jgi:hypothetical protein
MRLATHLDECGFAGSTITNWANNKNVMDVE